MLEEELPCDVGGLCTPFLSDRVVSQCIYCGKELIKKEGEWYTWDADLHSQQKPQF